MSEIVKSPKMATGEAEYEARRRRSAWSDSVRRDAEIKALDEFNGEWILCATCAAHYERTGRGRRPNDQLGFKVKMNGRFQEAAWIMHKNRVVAHRLGAVHATGNKRGRSDIDDAGASQGVNAPSTTGETSHEITGSIDEGLPSVPVHDYTTADVSDSATRSPRVEPVVQIPLSGWRCPGIVPDDYYSSNSNLVHAFAKYYVGSYRINVVRDIRTDRVLLFSHDCENRVVRRSRQLQSLACDTCHGVWTNNKSFRRILKKMERYNHVEDLLRRAWSLNSADLEALSRFKHLSASHLNIEGRKLKQAVIDVLRHYETPRLANEGIMSAVPHGDTLNRESSIEVNSVNGDDEGPSAIPESDVAPTTEPYHEAIANI